jgi:hypothetical protein
MKGIRGGRTKRSIPFCGTPKVRRAERSSRRWLTIKLSSHGSLVHAGCIITLGEDVGDDSMRNRCPRQAAKAMIRISTRGVPVPCEFSNAQASRTQSPPPRWHPSSGRSGSATSAKSSIPKNRQAAETKAVNAGSSLGSPSQSCRFVWPPANAHRMERAIHLFGRTSLRKRHADHRRDAVQDQSFAALRERMSD